MSKRINTRILLSVSLILFAVVTIAGATFAFFSDTETSTGNVLAAGELDLQIDNTSYYRGELNTGTTWQLADLDDGNGPADGAYLFFDFSDLKPSDWGEDTISLHVQNDAWLCADLTLTANEENSCTEPEELDELACTEDEIGELGENIEFVFWTDDGDNVLETDEAENIILEGLAQDVLDSEIILADATTNNVGGEDGDPMTASVTHYIAKAWCFGDLGLEPLSPSDDNTPANSTGGITCDGDLLDNSTQTDRITADIEFHAEQSRNNPGFTCSPVEVSCEANDIQYASDFSDNNQGDRKDFGAILANRTDPIAMFGAPQTSGDASDVGFPPGSFFALGFTGGNIVLVFNDVFYKNPSGNDLKVFEVTGGTYPDELVKVEVSLNGTDWSTASPNPGLRDAGFEMSIPSAKFVRLTEASDIDLFPDDADGYDVDAIQTFCKVQPN